MAIGVGDRLPEATFLRRGEAETERVPLAELTRGRKVVLFALPGAYTRTCTSTHVPSFIRTREAFRAKGVEGILCVAVNDPFVMRAWGEATGAEAAGIAMLSDADGAFTRAMGMDFDYAVDGFYGRSRRYAVYAEDGVVRVLQADVPGVCEVSGGEAMLEAI